MKIALIVEGATEKALKPCLIDFLRTRLDQRRLPRLHFSPERGRIPKGRALQRSVYGYLEKGSYDAVIAITDVYVGNQREFESATHARRLMRDWVGPEPRFYPHAAQFEFEAWLIPYWSRIQQLSRCNDPAPNQPPELINHGHPPSKWIASMYRRGRKQGYIKTVEAPKILHGADLTLAIECCPELKALTNTILILSGSEPLA